jgi:hypothetical protein
MMADQTEAEPELDDEDDEDDYDYSECDDLAHYQALFRLKRTLRELQTAMRRDPALRILVTQGWAAYEKFAVNNYKKS